jgi:hypothetical protein
MRCTSVPEVLEEFFTCPSYLERGLKRARPKMTEGGETALKVLCLDFSPVDCVSDADYNVQNIGVFPHSPGIVTCIQTRLKGFVSLIISWKSLMYQTIIMF